MASLEEAARQGARNLLNNCIGIAPGERLLVVREDPGCDYFDPRAADIVESEARLLGAEVVSLTTQRVAGPEAAPACLRAAMEHVEHTIFFSRIGDQMRFCALPGAGSKTMVYTFDLETLASEFARFPHDLMTDLLARLQAEIDGRDRWRISCPNGTDLTGSLPKRPPRDVKPGGFRLLLFPVVIFRPITCQDACGRIVISRWVNSTNTHLYEPEVLLLDSPVTALVEQGRIVDFEGPSEVTAALRAHYERVAEELEIDPWIVHSWHAGINPLTPYVGRAADDPIRWAGVAFASPRHLHFHSAGDYAPGEISLHLLDAKVTFDEDVLWQEGRLAFWQRADIQALMRDYGVSPEIFDGRPALGI